MNMMAANADLQYLGASNDDDLISVMSINQRGKEEETGSIKLNLFVISAKSHKKGTTQNGEWESPWGKFETRRSASKKRPLHGGLQIVAGRKKYLGKGEGCPN